MGTDRKEVMRELVLQLLRMDDGRGRKQRLESGKHCQTPKADPPNVGVCVGMHACTHIDQLEHLKIHNSRTGQDRTGLVVGGLQEEMDAVVRTRHDTSRAALDRRGARRCAVPAGLVDDLLGTDNP
jgi:hypothetical protein